MAASNIEDSEFFKAVQIKQHDEPISLQSITNGNKIIQYGVCIRNQKVSIEFIK